MHPRGRPAAAPQSGDHTRNHHLRHDTVTACLKSVKTALTRCSGAGAASWREDLIPAVWRERVTCKVGVMRLLFGADLVPDTEAELYARYGCAGRYHGARLLARLLRALQARGARRDDEPPITERELMAGVLRSRFNPAPPFDDMLRRRGVETAPRGAAPTRAAPLFRPAGGSVGGSG